MNIQTLESVCSKVTSGGTPSRQQLSYWQDGTIPWLKTGDIKKNFVYSVDEFITNEGLDNSSAKLLPINSVIIAMYGDGNTAGSVAVNKIELATNQACCNFIIDEKKADYRYVYHYLKGSYQNLVNLKSGGSQQNLNARTLKKFPIWIPSLETQQKIAGILSAYDELIENNKKRIALLETMAEELYKEWFVRFRFPNYENTEFEKGVPKNWQREEINYFCQEVKKSIKKENLNSEQKYIGLEHLSRKDFAIYDYATADTVDSDKLEFQKNDILFGKIRPYLHKVCLANFNGICSTDIIVIRAKKDLFFSYILLTVFSNTFVDLANVSSNGTKMPRANWGYLKKVKIPLPPQDLLKKFNEICLPIFQQIDVLLQENELLISKKNQLLPRLISGKLSVEHLDIQQPPTSAQPTHSE